MVKQIMDLELLLILQIGVKISYCDYFIWYTSYRPWTLYNCDDDDDDDDDEEREVVPKYIDKNLLSD